MKTFTFAQGSSEAVWTATRGADEASTATNFVTNDHHNSLLVVLSIDVTNTSGSEGDSFYCQIVSSACQFHGGERGAGASDTFPWRGAIAIIYGDSLQIVPDGGFWSASATGFYVPYHESLIEG